MSILEIEVMDMYFRLNRKNHIICILISITMVLSLHSMVGTILFNYVTQSFISSGNLIVNFVVSIILLSVLISIVRESIHGAIYKAFGGKIMFGFKGIYANTEEISGISLLRAQFLLVLLAPLVVISIISILIPTWLGGMIFLLNLLGASRDIYMALFLCKLRHNSKIIYKSDGFDVTE